MNVRMPDGTVIENVPDGMSRAELEKRLAKSGMDIEAMKFGPTQGMGSVERARAGMGKAAVDTVRGIGQLVGAESNEDVQESRNRDRALMNTTGGQVGNLAGNVGITLLPGAGVKTLAGGLKLAGSPAAGAAAELGTALLNPRTVSGGLSVGAGMGLVQPATSGRERLDNTVMGAAGGGAVPAVSRGVQVGKSLIEPLYERGQENIMARTLRRASGEDPGLGLKLRGANELVPGSEPTVGQAAGNAGVAALERSAAATTPEVTNAYTTRMQQQNQARVSDLRDMAGTEGKREFFDADRRAAADQLYEAAYAKGVDLRRDAVSGQFLTKAQQAARKGEITKLMSAPAMQQAMEDAKVLMQNELKKVDDPAGSVRGLDYVKRALDDKISKATGNEQRILIGLKNRLLTTIDTISPDYAKARTTFAEMSKPINQMDVAQRIADKSIRPLDDVLQPASYARNLSDDAAQTATGMRSASLEGVMSPDQLQRLKAIKDDLARAEFAKTAGRGTGSDTVQKMAYTNLMEQSGMPTWLRTLMPTQIVGNLSGRAADLIYGRANRELSERLAQLMLTPKEFSKVLDKVGPEDRSRLMELVYKGTTPLALAAPASVNAGK